MIVVTRGPVDAPSQPDCSLWNAFCWFVADLPMMSYMSPYSSDVQARFVLVNATFVPPEPQRSVEAWCTPRLCPSSCATTESENALSM